MWDVWGSVGCGVSCIVSVEYGMCGVGVWYGELATVINLAICVNGQST